MHEKGILSHGLIVNKYVQFFRSTNLKKTRDSELMTQVSSEYRKGGDSNRRRNVDNTKQVVQSNYMVTTQL